MEDPSRNPGIPLVLGTAQLGMDYGIANREGRPSMAQALDMVRTAWEGGIRCFDTARAYGESEEALGACFRNLGILTGQDPVAVISKLSPSVELSDMDQVLGELEGTLARLRLSRLRALMLHRESQLEQSEGRIARIAARLKKEDKITHFGVSVYSPEMAIKALKMDEIDVVQLPFNVFDQRAHDQGVFRVAGEMGKTVFIRSVYLQGLLLMAPERVAGEMAFSRGPLKRFRDACRDSEISPKALALAFVAQKAPDAMIVVGSETADQVKENVTLYGNAIKTDLPDLGFLSSHDQKLINPSLWPH